MRAACPGLPREAQASRPQQGPCRTALTSSWGGGSPQPLASLSVCLAVSTTVSHTSSFKSLILATSQPPVQEGFHQGEGGASGVGPRGCCWANEPKAAVGSSPPEHQGPVRISIQDLGSPTEFDLAKGGWAAVFETRDFPSISSFVLKNLLPRLA